MPLHRELEPAAGFLRMLLEAQLIVGDE